MKAKQKQIKKPVAARAKVSKPVAVRPKVSAKTTKKVNAKAPLHKRVRGHAKTVLVPHKENEFRPHLIRIHGLVAVLIVALIAQVSYSFVTTGQLSILGRVSDIQPTELLVDTNAERTEQGLSELRVNDQLSQAAFLKAQNMFAEQYWAHVSPSGIEPWKWLGDVGYNYSYAGENLAKNYPNANATVEAWMNSQTHRDNILKGEYTDVGFAVVDGELEGAPTTLVVALYATPMAAPVVEAAASEQKATGFLAPAVATSSQNPLTYFGSALEALSPVTIVILGLLAVVAIVGVAAHHYRRKLPKSWQRSWKLHHGMYTFVGTIVLGVLIVIATGGGQI